MPTLSRLDRQALIDQVCGEILRMGGSIKRETWLPQAKNATSSAAADPGSDKGQHHSSYEGQAS